MSETMDVVKRNPQGQETWRYTGEVLWRSESSVLLQAQFNRHDIPFHGITLGRGDRFVEIFYSDRWYNIFEMHDRDDDRLKGWYCNVCQPAVFQDGEVSYIDLALDLLVYPDGRQLVLDEDEFAGLDIGEEVCEQARAALRELQARFADISTFRLAPVPY